MPRPGYKYKPLGMKPEDYAFFEDFAKKVSAQLGFEVTIVQALRKAAVQYEVTEGLAK